MPRPIRHPLTAPVFAAALAAALASATPALAQTAAPPAQAQPAAVSAQGGLALASAIEAGLKRWFPADKTGDSLRWTGTTAAVPAGDFYQVTLPSLSLVDEKKSRLDVGIIRLAVKPLADGTYQVGLSLSPSMPAFDEDGAADGALTIGKQQIFGRWDPRFQTFLALDAALGEVAAANGKGQPILRLASLTAKGELKPDGETTYSGPGAITLGGLQVHDKDGVPVAHIGTLSAEGSYTRINLAKLSALTDGVPSPAPAPAPSPAPMPSPTPAPSTVSGAPAPAPMPPMPALSDLKGLFAAASFSMRVDDTAFTNPEEAQRFGWKQMQVRGGVQGLDGDSAAMTLGFSQSGLTIDPVPGPADFMPESIDLSLAVGKVPTAALSQAFAASTVPGLDVGTAGAAAGFELLGALGQAGTEVKVERFSVVTPATAGTLNGQATFTQGAMFGTVGAFSLVMRGLDSAIKALAPKRGKPDPEAQSNIQALTMIQALGQQSKDEQGKELRTYRIDITPEGKLLLNGTDLAPMFGGGEEPEAAPAPAPARKNPKRT